MGNDQIKHSKIKITKTHSCKHTFEQDSAYTLIYMPMLYTSRDYGNLP